MGLLIIKLQVLYTCPWSYWPLVNQRLLVSVKGAQYVLDQGGDKVSPLNQKKPST